MRFFSFLDNKSNLYVSQGGDLPPIVYITGIVLIILIILGASGVL